MLASLLGEIWEATRPTSATSTFESIQIEQNRHFFLDGALTDSNNLVRMANVESRNVWPSASRLILNVGDRSRPWPSRYRKLT